MVGTLTAADLAVQAHQEREARKTQEAASEAARKERKRLQEWRYMETVLDRARPTLSRWFPHAAWELFSPLMSNGIPASDWTAAGQLALVRSDDHSLYLTIDSKGVEVSPVIHVVEQQHDPDTGYDYWSGPEVKTPADIGAFVKARR